MKPLAAVFPLLKRMMQKSLALLRTHWLVLFLIPLILISLILTARFLILPGVVRSLIPSYIRYDGFSVSLALRRIRFHDLRILTPSSCPEKIWVSAEKADVRFASLPRVHEIRVHSPDFPPGEKAFTGKCLPFRRGASGRGMFFRIHAEEGSISLKGNPFVIKEAFLEITVPAEKKAVKLAGMKISGLLRGRDRLQAEGNLDIENGTASGGLKLFFRMEKLSSRPEISDALEYDITAGDLEIHSELRIRGGAMTADNEFSLPGFRGQRRRKSLLDVTAVDYLDSLRDEKGAIRVRLPLRLSFPPEAEAVRRQLKKELETLVRSRILRQWNPLGPLKKLNPFPF